MEHSDREIKSNESPPRPSNSFLGRLSKGMRYATAVLALGGSPNHATHAQAGEVIQSSDVAIQQIRLLLAEAYSNFRKNPGADQANELLRLVQEYGAQGNGDDPSIMKGIIEESLLIARESGNAETQKIAFGFLCEHCKDPNQLKAYMKSHRDELCTAGQFSMAIDAVGFAEEKGIEPRNSSEELRALILTNAGKHGKMQTFDGRLSTASLRLRTSQEYFNRYLTSKEADDLASARKFSSSLAQQVAGIRLPLATNFSSADEISAARRARSDLDALRNEILLTNRAMFAIQKSDKASKAALGEYKFSQGAWEEAFPLLHEGNSPLKKYDLPSPNASPEQQFLNGFQAWQDAEATQDPRLQKNLRKLALSYLRRALDGNLQGINRDTASKILNENTDLVEKSGVAEKPNTGTARVGAPTQLTASTPTTSTGTRNGETDMGFTSESRLAAVLVASGSRVTIEHEGKEKKVTTSKDMPVGELSIVGIEMVNNSASNLLVHLSKLPKLRFIKLANCAVNNALFDNVSQLPPTLIGVDISKTDVSAQTLSRMLESTKLVNLRLESCPVDDQMMEQIAKNDALRNFSLFGSNTTNKGLSYFENSKVEHFGLVGMKITSASLTSLPPTLKTLNVSESPINDLDVVNITRRFTGLTTLDLRDTQITDQSIGNISTMSSLKSLKIKGTRVSQNGFQMLRAKLPNCVIE